MYGNWFLPHLNFLYASVNRNIILGFRCIVLTLAQINLSNVLGAEDIGCTVHGEPESEREAQIRCNIQLWLNCCQPQQFVQSILLLRRKISIFPSIFSPFIRMVISFYNILVLSRLPDLLALFSLHFSHYIANWRRILMDLWLELFRFQFTLFATQPLMVANETRCSYSISVIKLLFFLLSNKLSPEDMSICRDSQ